MNKIIIIGASSGIGKELARLYKKNNDVLGLAARRLNLLEELKNELGSEVFIAQMDVSKPEEASQTLLELIDEMGGVDLLLISAGTGYINPNLEWKYECETIDINIKGFTALATAGMKYFMQKECGHLAAISSIAALRGSGTCPAYNASKAYISNYLEGLSCKAKLYGKNITVTDIKPGFVNTAMAQGEGLFWVASPEKAAKQIFRIINRRKSGGYVTKRWGLIAVLFKIMPRRLYIWICNRSERAEIKTT